MDLQMGTGCPSGKQPSYLINIATFVHLAIFCTLLFSAENDSNFIYELLSCSSNSLFPFATNFSNKLEPIQSVVLLASNLKLLLSTAVPTRSRRAGKRSAVHPPEPTRASQRTKSALTWTISGLN